MKPGPRLDHVRQRTQLWVAEFVVGLGLCPFAKSPLEAGTLRVVVSAAEEPAALIDSLVAELARLAAAKPEELETTLLVHPDCLGDFDSYNAFLDLADELLGAQELEGVIQIASFHPEYRFADAPPHDPANYTNRSPYPMLHLIREESVSRAVENHPDIAGVPVRNVALLRGMDPAELARLADPDES